MPIMNRGRPKTFDDNDALERAMKVFWKSGYDATSLDDLLSAMDIPRQSLYRTFSDKRTLFLRALELYGNRMSGTISNILQADGLAIDNINSLFKLWNDGLTSAERDGCMMQNTCSQSEQTAKEAVALVTAHQKRITKSFEQALKQGQLEGSISKSIDTRAVARTIISSINGLFGLSRMGLKAEFSNDVIKTIKSLIQVS
jgi:TetR/AcrR family transcriptional repressor of nem operon